MNIGLTADDWASDLTSKVALVTGANTGIGKVTARELAARGAHVFVACRSAQRAEPVVEELRSASGNPKVELLMLDLGDLDSVRDCATQFLDRGLPLHLLINNAGLAGQRGFTKSGFELAFGVNHVGHFLLTQLLLPCIERSAAQDGLARIVHVASKAHYNCKHLDFDVVRQPTRVITALPEYNASKLANVLFSAELARRLGDRNVHSYALHPGVVASDVWRAVPQPFRWLITRAMIDVEQGARTTLHCALSAQAAEQNGLYYDSEKPKRPSALARDEELAAELWRRSEEWVAPHMA